MLVLILASAVLLGTSKAYAHQSGCHRWHSCPSDSGSYVCGDLGYDTYCGTSSPAPTYTAPTQPKPTYTPPSSTATPQATPNYTQPQVKSYSTPTNVNASNYATKQTPPNEDSFNWWWIVVPGGLAWWIYAAIKQQ